jgi:UDP-2,4-diacetamido-2,4,6-trideoxy-beta-L-altropyranose hydrolase
MVGPAAEYQVPGDVELFKEWHCVSGWNGEEEDAACLVDIARRLGCSRAVLDDYRVQQRYQEVVLRSGTRWLQFDSHAVQPFFADWVLCASPGADRGRYELLRRRKDTLFLLGSRFAVISESYRQTHARAKPRVRLQRLLLCFGGGDDRGATARVLQALSPVASNYRFDVIMGRANPHQAEVAALLNTESFCGRSALHVDTQKIAGLMLKADAGIISGGTISFEACAAGLPTLLLAIANNQLANLRGWTEAGVSIGLGVLDAMDPQAVRDAVGRLASEPSLLSRMSTTALDLVDGKGGERVSRELLVG